MFAVLNPVSCLGWPPLPSPLPQILGEREHTGRCRSPLSPAAERSRSGERNGVVREPPDPPSPALHPQGGRETSITAGAVSPSPSLREGPRVRAIAGSADPSRATTTSSTAFEKRVENVSARSSDARVPPCRAHKGPRRQQRVLTDAATPFRPAGREVSCRGFHTPGAAGAEAGEEQYQGGTDSVRSTPHLILQ